MWGTGVATSWLSRRHGNGSVGLKFGIATKDKDL